MEKGNCLRCHKVRLLTQHHIYPRTHYKDCHEVVYLCASCHIELEQRILAMEGSKKGIRHKLRKEDYYNLLLNFLSENIDE
jgi:hypothetical protein